MASKKKKVKQKNRYDAALLYMEGYSGKQISEFLHISHRTVSSHIAGYESGGMEALRFIKQPGGSKKIIVPAGYSTIYDLGMILMAGRTRPPTSL